jgi:hypothetical protein
LDDHALPAISDTHQAATKLRGFFIALFHPIRSDVTTNMQVIQTSILLKYKSLFGFLQRQAPSVALEVQRSYVGAARMYYETGFRRYIRSLGWIKVSTSLGIVNTILSRIQGRTTEKLETIVTTIADKDMESTVDTSRLAYARVEGPPVTLAFMADDKTHVSPS